jgi:hypothetical protein
MDKRGRHNNRAKIDSEFWNILENWINKFPSHLSHYSSNKTNKKFFDDTSLNISKLFKKFIKFLNKSTRKPVKLGFVSFYYYFKENLNFGFSTPRVDICDTCFEYSQIGLNKLNENEKQQYNEHICKVNLYRKFKNECMDNKFEKLILEFDYCQTKPLPKLPNNSYYYSSVISFNLFNIHNHNINESQMFYFLEGEFQKGPNTICSFLFSALQNLISIDIKLLVLFSDACGAQNRNYTVLKFLSWFSMNFNIKIIQVFPVRGHSYCTCDRNFANFSKLPK